MLRLTFSFSLLFYACSLWNNILRSCTNAQRDLRKCCPRTQTYTHIYSSLCLSSFMHKDLSRKTIWKSTLEAAMSSVSAVFIGCNVGIMNGLIVTNYGAREYEGKWSMKDKRYFAFNKSLFSDRLHTAVVTHWYRPRVTSARDIDRARDTTFVTAAAIKTL